MSEQQANLLPFYKGWDNYQSQLIQAITPLTAEQLALRLAPHLRSVGENATHIIGTRVGWFHHIMGEGDSSLAPLDDWDIDGAPERSADELIAGLEASWQLVHHTLARWTPADLNYTFEKKWSDQTHYLTRQWIIWHVIEHDIHHGGEISFVLGMHNITAIDL